MKVLIVDDSNFMRTILKNIIKGQYADAEVIEAANGDEALTKYNAEKPDVILLDIIMPGKDGMTVLKEVGPSAKSVVIISSIDQPEVINQATSLGAKGYIVKPYDESEVLSMLQTVMQ
jgi:two-component system, chemotaxis family, chemotaxis protein CheY